MLAKPDEPAFDCVVVDLATYQRDRVADALANFSIEETRQLVREMEAELGLERFSLRPFPGRGGARSNAGEGS